MNSNFGLTYDNKFKFIENIDEELKDPNKKIRFGDGEYTLREIRSLIPSREEKIRMFIEWDNMCQYTAFGLVEKLNEITKQNRKINLHDFLRRKEYPNGIDYVKNVTYKDAKPELIDGILKKYYPEILQMSPQTNFLIQLNFMSFMTESVTFMFRFDHPQIENLLADISNVKFNNKVVVNKMVLPNEEAEKKYIKLASTFDYYLVPDMGLYYQELLNLNRNNTSIMGYRDHNGISDAIMAFYVNVFYKDNLPGPNNIYLAFLDEYKPTKEDEEKWDENRHIEL